MEEKERRYQPQEFAKIIGVTKRALRYYDEVGILKPSYVNEDGYKFYTDRDFFEAQRIVSLRFLEFSVEEIREMQKKNTDIGETIHQQKRMMQEKVNQILQIISTLDEMEEAVSSSNAIPWENLFHSVKLAKYKLVRDNMMEYYNQRADEYEEIYEGKGPATYPTSVYEKDMQELHQFWEGFGSGHVFDIGCGTGYWMKEYARNCTRFTFLDQSSRMLQLCGEKTIKYGIEEKSEFIEADATEYEFPEEQHFDCAVMGFLLGHFTKFQETIFFEKLRKWMKQGSSFIVIESTWTQKRARGEKKEDIAVRKLEDGRKFQIYKRYFEQGELEQLLEKNGCTVQKSFFGTTFTAVIGTIGEEMAR